MKVICPFHEEATPSCHVYADNYRCYGCGKTGPLKDLEGKLPLTLNIRRPRKGWAKPENLSAALARINKLPIKGIRGLELPYDAAGYYIVYPQVDYYVKRLWEPKGNSDKYRGPSGHKKPLLAVGTHNTRDTLFVVEGQLNALSLAATLTCNVVSPGGASDLNRPVFVQYYLQYTHICIIVDKDPAGVVAGIALRDELLKHRKVVALLPLEKDLNDQYQEGKEAVRETVRRALAML